MLTKPDPGAGQLGTGGRTLFRDGDHVVFTAYRTPIFERATIEVLSINDRLVKGVVDRECLRFLRSDWYPLFCGGRDH